MEKNKLSMATNNDFAKKTNQPERYKIKVSGLPRFYAMADPLLQEFLKCIRQELKLNCIYARFVRKGNAWLYLTFPSAEEQQKALNALKRYHWKGRTLVSMLVTSDVLKRKTDGSEDEVVSYDSKKQKIDIPISEQVLMSTIPYYSLSYGEQLRQKNEEAHSLVCRLHEILTKRGPQLVNWCTQRKKLLNSSIPFVLDHIRPSPIIDGYRNKYEFSVGLNPDTETVAVGIRVQDRRDGIHHVGPADGLRHLPKPMISLVKIFEKFVVERGDEWDFWYHLIVRINRNGEIMVTVSTNPNKKQLSEDKMENLKDEVRKCFTTTSENVVSLYFQVHGDKPISDTVGIPSKSELLWGRDHIKEKLLNLELEITPVTYFRINSAAAEILCRSVAELANVDKETTLLDLFCGSGSLALTLAPKCKEVIAVELIETNIKDARKYAEINNITNCEFIAGKIEDIINSILTKLKNKKVVVILDPPRTGVDPTLVKTLREFKEAIRFIYVCSNHKLPLKNLLDFSSLTGQATDPDPIIPVRIIPIDMTPHTLRSELVILCERFDLSSLTFRQRKNSDKSPTCMETGATKSFYPTSATNRNILSPPGGGVHAKYANFPNTAHHNRSPANFSTSPQSNFSNRFLNSTSFPPRVPPFNSNSNSFCSTSLEDFYAEDRYSSFRRDFEKAIDSSYSSSFDPSVNANEFLPLDMVRKIEERAFREGLTRGIQQCAYQVGYQLGLRSSAEKLLNYDDLIGFPSGGGASGSGTGSNTSNNSSSGIWEPPNGKFSPSTAAESSSSSWLGSPSMSCPNANGFQNWNRLSSPTFGNVGSLSDPPNQNVLWK
ncbi:tRNA (uracil-5-)-methyltransferase homolog A-like [Planococcus citri]|uniref:tRNA (uracil-5-)-methyltransferase homolog A-like n=1 Tax=Planococcus citri TaxID=170843 RepID=UPI0031F87F4F